MTDLLVSLEMVRLMASYLLDLLLLLRILVFARLMLWRDYRRDVVTLVLPDKPLAQLLPYNDKRKI